MAAITIRSLARADRWHPRSLIAVAWSRQILASHGLALPPPKGLWLQCNSDQAAAFDALTMHRLDSHAAFLCSQQDAPELPPELADTLSHRRRRQVIAAMRQASVAKLAADALAESGVRALFVKGLSQAVQSTGDWTRRGPGDVDVLVAADQHDMAVAVLAQAGAELSQPQGMPHEEVRLHMEGVHHAASLVLQGTHIDLHRRLDPNPGLMRLSFDELWRQRVTVAVGGARLPTLDPLNAAVFAASHGSQDNWAHLRSVIDFALAANAACELDVQTLTSAAVRQGVGRRMALALQMLRLVVDDTPDMGLRARLLANWAWSRHRAGRLTRGSARTQDAMGTFAFWLASEGGTQSYSYGLRRLTWLPSVEHRYALSGRWSRLAPALAPVNAVSRLRARAQSRSLDGLESRRSGPHRDIQPDV